MVTIKFLVLCVGFFAINVKKTHAISKDERKELLTILAPHFIECSAKYEIGEDIVQAVKKGENFENVDICFIACVMKRVDLLDNEGKYNIGRAKEIVKKYINEEEKQKKIEAIIDECSKVNDEEVSDGAEGCERMKLLRKCLLPYKKLMWSE